MQVNSKMDKNAALSAGVERSLTLTQKKGICDLLCNTNYVDHLTTSSCGPKYSVEWELQGTRFQVYRLSFLKIIVLK